MHRSGRRNHLDRSRTRGVALRRYERHIDGCPGCVRGISDTVERGCGLSPHAPRTGANPAGMVRAVQLAAFPQSSADLSRVRSGNRVADVKRWRDKNTSSQCAARLLLRSHLTGRSGSGESRVFRYKEPSAGRLNLWRIPRQSSACDASFQTISSSRNRATARLWEPGEATKQTKRPQEAGKAGRTCGQEGNGRTARE